MSDLPLVSETVPLTRKVTLSPDGGVWREPDCCWRSRWRRSLRLAARIALTRVEPVAWRPAHSPVRHVRFRNHLRDGSLAGCPRSDGIRRQAPSRQTRLARGTVTKPQSSGKTRSNRSPVRGDIFVD